MKEDTAPTPRVDAEFFEQIEASRFESMLHELADKINALMKGRGLLYGQIALPENMAAAKLLTAVPPQQAQQQQAAPQQQPQPQAAPQAAPQQAPQMAQQGGP